EGPLALIPTLRPTLRVGGVRIANPPGFSGPQFASLGQARLRLELLPLLRSEIRVVKVEAEDVRVRLEEAADRRVNWDFGTSAPTPASPQPAASAAAPVRIEAIASVALRNINVEYVRGGRSRYFALDEMIGGRAWPAGGAHAARRCREELPLYRSHRRRS